MCQKPQTSGGYSGAFQWFDVLFFSNEFPRRVTSYIIVLAFIGNVCMFSQCLLSAEFLQFPLVQKYAH